jgi:peptide/nickel transport system substrate-binding protein
MVGLLQVLGREQDVALWAEVDRAIVEEAPYVWLVNPILIEFVSDRVGNYQYSPQWGTLLDQLWVR